MFGLPRDTNLDFLIGCQLEQLAFGEYQFQLRFSQGVVLSVENKIGILIPGIATEYIWNAKNFSDISQFSLIFSHLITRYEIPGNGDLILHFENGITLSVYECRSHFESYHITSVEGVLVV